MIRTITCLTHEKLYVVVNLFCSSREAWETRNESNSLVKLPDTQADVRRSKRTRVLELPRTQWLINFWRKILDFLNTPALWKNTSWQTCLDGVSTFCNPRSNYKAPRISEGSTIHPLPSTRSFAQLVPSFQLLRSHPFSINEPAEGGIERKSLNFARARLPFFLPYLRFFFSPAERRFLATIGEVARNFRFSKSMALLLLPVYSFSCPGQWGIETERVGHLLYSGKLIIGLASPTERNGKEKNLRERRRKEGLTKRERR